MPTTGAIYLVNGRKRKGKAKTRRARRSASFGRVIARLKNGRFAKKNSRKTRSRSRRRNGLALRTNRRRNGLALRTNRRRNGLALRTNGRRRSNRKSRRSSKGRRRNGTMILRNGRRRRNGLALRTNGRRRNSRRRNGLALRTNRRRGKGRRRNSTYIVRNRRHNGRRRNGFGVRSFLSPVQGVIRKVPVIGPVIAAALPGMLGAAVVIGAVHLALKATADYVPAEVAQYTTPIGYTLGGIALSILIAFVPKSLLSSKTKAAVAALAVTGGVAVDVVRKMSDSSATAGFGDGGLWALGSTSGVMDEDESALAGSYGDASLIDAACCDDDLTAEEGEAALAGPRAWRIKFPFARQLTNIKRDATSKHARKQGHRWGWLIRLIGFQRFRTIAAAPPAQRIAFIKSLKEFAISKADEQFKAAQLTESASPQPMMGRLGALLYAQ